jgi:PadR family transcriptional regulator PadR
MKEPLACQCGKVFRSMSAEAVHRHNFPALCKVTAKPVKALGSFEYSILRVLINQPTNAYGLVIKERVEAATGRACHVGAIYSALERLHTKGYVRSQWGEPTPERGGRRKRYYRIEPTGREAVRRTQAVFKSS